MRLTLFKSSSGRVALAFALLFSFVVIAQCQSNRRTVSGAVATDHNEVVPGATVIVQSSVGKIETLTDVNGRFRLLAPNQLLKIRVTGRHIVSQEKAVSASDSQKTCNFL